ncbi:MULTISPECIES: glycosyltransferase [Pseudomonas]|uniref:glycosyltransferase n=1 Tax=Pseudomonas guariconensis TaxID=1288410 RepID=UPI002097B723|nr:MULTISPECIES: glycosyltransferase [Pseudomonas]MCO7596021.1 glycosyltransferase [Pseudomonas guariconensis]MCU7222213.1 glycosyltransferase [Pseudomonas brassicacearum]
MKKIAIFASSTTTVQLESIASLAEREPNNQFFLQGANIKGENIKQVSEQADFLNICGDADDLIILADVDFQIDEKMLNSFYSHRLGNVWHMLPDGETKQYRLNPRRKASVLLIFPGSILPLTLGSHQRAFNLLFNLSKQGVAVDLLITTPKNVKQSRFKTALETFCNNVYFYKNNKKKPSKLEQYTRAIEIKARKALGKTADLPDLFSERAKFRPTESCKRWANSLHVANRYQSIIVSYAWMMDAVKYIKHDRENFKLICDTHDVQFTRNEQILNRSERLFFSASREKRCELKKLKICDSVIAISESDEQILAETLPAHVKVIKASSGFDYALAPVKRRPHGRPLAFGFIGGQMSANVKSLSFILDEWWPAIKKYSPDSKFYIAGSVCNAPDILPKIFFDNNIEALGFVDNISDFYDRIEVSLNPVVVQGGLNFKSVEAVFAGKHLFTNKLGQECLGTDFPSTIISSESDIRSFLKKYEFDIKKDTGVRTHNQNKAQSLFSNKNVYRELFNYFAAQH